MLSFTTSVLAGVHLFTVLPLGIFLVSVDPRRMCAVCRRTKASAGCSAVVPGGSCDSRGERTCDEAAALPRFTPLETWPALRPLAPKPKSSASSTTTLAPARRRVIAAFSPVKPPPTIATSARSGGVRPRLRGGASSHQ